MKCTSCLVVKIEQTSTGPIQFWAAKSHKSTRQMELTHMPFSWFIKDIHVSTTITEWRQQTWSSNASENWVVMSWNLKCCQNYIFFVDLIFNKRWWNVSNRHYEQEHHRRHCKTKRRTIYLLLLFFSLAFLVHFLQ